MKQLCLQGPWTTCVWVFLLQIEKKKKSSFVLKLVFSTIVNPYTLNFRENSFGYVVFFLVLVFFFIDSSEVREDTRRFFPIIKKNTARCVLWIKVS